MASSLSRRVRMIEGSIALLNHLYERLKYLQPTIFSLMEGAAKLGQFESCPYLNDCCAHMRQGESFSASWKQAVQASADLLGKDEAALLGALGDTLGCTDLDSQLTAIAYTRELLEAKLTAARDYQCTHSKLYRTLGLLTGVGIAIILG